MEREEAFFWYNEAKKMVKQAEAARDEAFERIKPYFVESVCKLMDWKEDLFETCKVERGNILDPGVKCEIVLKNEKNARYVFVFTGTFENMQAKLRFRENIF